MNDFFSDMTHEFALPFTNPVLIFAVLLAIVLLAPLLLKRFNVPSIIGLIVAGVIIGPFGLNLVDNNHQGVSMFSTIGLLYIMFIAGLELDLNEFISNKNKSLVFGLFTFILPLSVGFPVCYYLLGYDLSASFLTASMFATHTLVTYPIVSRMGVAKNQAVAITVGGTILTDTAVLIILALVLSGNDGGLDLAFLVRLLISLVAFSSIVFLLIPRITRWFFQQAEGEKYLHYIFVLFVVFFCGFLAELGGIEPIIGAFAAGLALNRLIPHSSALMNRIEFFGNSLFIPIFLISVGMLVDVSVVFDGPATLLIALTLTVTAIAGKWVAAFFTQVIFKYSAIQRNIIFGLSSSHAAATIAVIIVGYNAGILDEYILNGTIILILLTCIVASLVTQKSAKELAISQENAPLSDSDLGAFAQEKILVPIANPSNIGHHVELALLMKDRQSVNSVSLLGVVPNNEEAEKNIVSFRKQLEEFVQNAVAADIDVDIVTTIDHNAASGIVRTARELMCDIVILGWPGKTGMLEKLLGDKVDLIIKNIDRNMFICHIEHELFTHKRIVVVSPPLVEREIGFDLWLQKVVELSKELSVPILHLGHPDTQAVIAAKKNSGSLFSFKTFVDWHDPLSCGDHIREGDMIIFVSAHQGYLSHMSILDNLPTRLEERFPHHSRIVIYPKQRTMRGLLESDDSLFVPSNF
ncbi:MULTISPECIES: cation:proton antiporter [Petrimonas]|jgi:Kef-type K+ transport system membrane component KefB/nucleotide-binding universal stress UspA family protein|uniref:Na(+)/H(+) antiporter NhaS5 n=3 Tax=Petrimonas mucosa TaxID=1642646 RepID=A0A1G4G4K2_9BACT|nr:MULTISPECIES: cation:proton antiporter [Petrimonas]MDD3560707.1 cation:proton antiporter [Petrimonas mucosa]SCM55849.1 Na(+)/H(+) antiporter NhaS5 [Petrimonas mucosa]SFU45215.1 transporter, CPA2 family [Porphyromonadaceae bacterium KHP3R9]HHT30520.1 cation:proton antiporter [Petrimonas mucosa]